MSTAARLVAAACHYVQFLDVDSVRDQIADPLVAQERVDAEVELLNAVAAIQQERGA